MKIKLKMKNKWYDIIRPKSKYGHKYMKCKKCLSIMFFFVLSNIWSIIHEKVKQHWGWVEKKRLLIKKTCNATNC